MTKKAISLALAAGVLAAALAGCTDDGDGTPEAEGSGSATAGATEGVDPANVSPSDLPDVPALKRERGLGGGTRKLTRKGSDPGWRPTRMGG